MRTWTLALAPVRANAETARSGFRAAPNISR